MEYNNPLKEKEVVIDVETGGTSSEDDVNIDPSVSGNRCISRLLSKPSIGLLGYNGSEKGESSGIANGNRGNSGEDSVAILIDKNLGGLQSEEDLPFLEKKHGKEKRKAINYKKARKPPRPPKGPSLNASDLKLVKEISELTMKKRARIERIKTLKKMQAAKSSSPSSSNSTLTAMIVTAVFCFVIILQGFCSRNTPTPTFQGSPEPAGEPKGLISVQFYTPHERADQSSESPSVARQRFLFQGSGLQDRSREIFRNK